MHGTTIKKIVALLCMVDGFASKVEQVTDKAIERNNNESEWIYLFHKSLL